MRFYETLLFKRSWPGLFGLKKCQFVITFGEYQFRSSFTVFSFTAWLSLDKQLSQNINYMLSLHII